MRPAIARLVGATERPVRGEDFAERAAGIDLAALDQARGEAKQILVERLRARFEHAFFERRDSPALLGRVLDGLDERALWIGFARRFAPYKRARLVLEDPERLRALLGDAARPVRLVFAGKAHPRDGLGKEILRDLARLSRSAEFAGQACSSSRTTTSTWRARWSRASTSGSTRPRASSRPAAPRA